MALKIACHMAMTKKGKPVQMRGLLNAETARSVFIPNDVAMDSPTVRRTKMKKIGKEYYIVYCRTAMIFCDHFRSLMCLCAVS